MIAGDIDFMKVLMLCGIFLSVIVHPTHAALTPEDLDKIRLIVKEEIRSEIQPLEARVRKVEENVARLEGRMTGVEQRFDDIDKRFDGVEQQIAHTTYITYALIALIVIGVGIPQMLIASRWRKDVQLEKQVQSLVAEIETLKQQRIHTP